MSFLMTKMPAPPPLVLPEIREVPKLADDDREKERAKSRWAQLAAVVGAEPRIKQITEDLIKHFVNTTH